MSSLYCTAEILVRGIRIIMITMMRLKKETGVNQLVNIKHRVHLINKGGKCKQFIKLM